MSIDSAHTTEKAVATSTGKHRAGARRRFRQNVIAAGAAVCATAGLMLAPTSSLAADGGACPEVLPEPTKVNLGFRPSSLAAFPLNVALAKGYFSDRGLEVELTEFPGAANPHIPSLARGDIDVIFSGISVAVFNAQIGGFDIKVFFPVGGEAEGYSSQIDVVARPELFESGVLDDPEKIKELRIDGLVQGVNMPYMIDKLLQQLGIADEAEIGFRTPSSPLDIVTLFKRGEVDISGMLPPLDVLMEKEGTAKIWKSAYEILGNFQSGILLGNPEFLTEKRCAAVAFARAVRQASADIIASGGEWTPELVQLAVDSTNLPEDVVLATRNTPYFPTSGTIDVESLQDQLEYFDRQGLITGDVDLDAMIDLGVLEELGE